MTESLWLLLNRLFVSMQQEPFEIGNCATLEVADAGS
jgi:hypothetical protein